MSNKAVQKLAVTLLLALAPAAGVVAGDKKAKEHDAIRSALQRGEVLPLSKILTIAAQRVPGDVVEVELETEEGALVYEIKILTDGGRVREIKIDARTGVVLEIEDD
jgi:uncharacterized membrane protein YkoI